MHRVMERHTLLAGLFVLLLGMFALTGTASAHSARRAKSKKAAPKVFEETEEQVCQAIPKPSTVPDVGEFGAASSIAVILEVECEATYAERKVRIASNELWAKCNKKLKWLEPGTVGHTELGPIKMPEAGLNEGKEFLAELDDDGNVTVAIFGGPSCAAEGGALVTVDLEGGATTTTEITITEPEVTLAGIKLYPEDGGIEDATDSSLVGLAMIAFPPGYAEETVSITDRQLFEKCLFAPKLTWFGPDGTLIKEGSPEAAAVLDNDGNAFVVFEAGESCKSGNTLFEVSLEEPPYTTQQANFKVLPPQSTFKR